MKSCIGPAKVLFAPLPAAYLASLRRPEIRNV